MKEEDIWTKTMRRYLKQLNINYIDYYYEDYLNNAESVLNDWFVDYIFKINGQYMYIKSLEELIMRLDLIGC